jgi:hypothetical protein
MAISLQSDGNDKIDSLCIVATLLTPCGKKTGRGERILPRGWGQTAVLFERNGLCNNSYNKRNAI